MEFLKNDPTCHPPSGQILSLITSLSNHQNHAQHQQALAFQSSTLSSSPLSYSNTCVQYARVLAFPHVESIPHDSIQIWKESDGGVSLMALNKDPIAGWNQLREMAGLLLKNALLKAPIDENTKMKMKLLPDASTEIKGILCKCIVDANHGIRRVGASIVSSCSLGQGGIADGMEPLPLGEHRWGEGILMPFLVNCLESAIGMMTMVEHGENGKGPVAMPEKIQYALLGSLQTLDMMLEDDAGKLERTTGPAFQKIVPCLLKLLRICGEHRVKVDSLKCCVNLIRVMPGSLIAQMNELLGVLSMLAGDEMGEVRKYVCVAIVTLLSTRCEYLQEHMLPVSQFMLRATADADEEVALEACEFWLVFSSLDESTCTMEMMAAVESVLPQLLPILVKCMVYSEESKEELLEQNAADELEVEDREQDIAPVFHRSKTKGGARKDDGEDSEGDDEDDDDEDEGMDDEREWTVRTCAAASLDGLATILPSSSVLPILLPILQECLMHADPWVREAGILALGALETGCGDEICQHLHQLHPYLMNQVESLDILPQVVCISCWTLGKYSYWAVEQTASGAQPYLVEKMTEAIVGRILDKNRKVQMASCSALGTIIENAQDLMVPYLEPIYRSLVMALQRHRTRALLITLETFGAVAETIGPATGEGSLPSIYIPPLMDMWRERGKANPMDRVLLPLMESLASISVSIGINFQPWALQVFEGAMGTINAALMTLSAKIYTDEEADPIVCATDVLDGLVEGLGPNFAELLSSGTQYQKDHFLSLLYHLVSHDIDGVRMSAFALMGDLAKQCPVVLQDGMSELITEAIACIDPFHPSVCNNAVWALGEVVIRCVGNPAALEPYAEEIVQNLISLIMGSLYGGQNDDEEDYGNPIAGLIENASTTMGRMAKVNPTFVSKDLARFLNGWMNGCSKISDMTERVDAFEGLLLSIQANPHCIKQASANLDDTINGLLFAILSWHIPDEKLSPSILVGEYVFTPFPPQYSDLYHELGTFLHQLKDSLTMEGWGSVANHLPVNVRRLFREQYSLC
mmetsp:Transcript_17129/g.32404  ORF Transcript_17129/g.32404 Transcript_17129/m.32404 type:complete len:1038 (+) Transcript_17129:63-3176(+)